MISKVSFFNKGIYKSTVKRYLWGAIVYFIVLFISTGMAILLSVDKTSTEQYRYFSAAILFNGDFSVFPTLLLICVPTFAAVLIFRFIHSKKTSVFMHSLPSTRTSNYISSVLAGLTLMAVPVILNGIILMIISACGYTRFFDITSCVQWVVLNLYILFIMFSCSVFSASITGNSFAMIGLNILLHGFVPLGAAGFSVVADKFLYGYNGSNAILNSVIEYNFVNDAATVLLDYSYKRLQITEVIFNLAAALVMYAFAFVLYKKRRLETAEDVAAYKCLNPIYKYLVTFLATIAAFSVFSTFIAEKPITLLVIVVIVSAVVYFACEMILKKTLRVWPSYKGYIGFALCCTAITLFTAQTSFFGYETRIPEKEDIAQAAIYNFYYGEDEPFTSDPQIIDSLINAHKDLTKKENIYTVEQIYRTADGRNNRTRIHMKYILKNGKTLDRAYPVTYEKCYELMDVFYSNEDYKKTCENIFSINDNVISVYVNGIKIDTDKLPSFVEAIQKDILSLSFEQIFSDETYLGIAVNIDYEVGRTDANNIISNYFNRSINANYVNTVAWLKENNIWDKIERAEKYKYADAVPETAEVTSAVY